MKRHHLIIDVARCIDCNNCFLACKDEFVGNDWLPHSLAQPLHGHRWIDIMRKERGQYPLVDVAYRPTPCMHCDNADCIKAADNGAIYKREDGIVVIDPVKARGQRKIVDSCPYGTIFWNDELQIPQKCTLCAHLLEQGWKEPRCVQACAPQALRLVLVEDTAMERIAGEESLQVLHPEYELQPTVFYKNLYRYEKCFIGGSVAVEAAGVTDCLKGARITLLRGPARVDETVSDSFGDFRFDDLEENSGKYTLEIVHPGYQSNVVHLDLRASINVGIVWLQVQP